MTCIRKRLEAELSQLETLPTELAERHLAWRWIESFTARDPERMLFWSILFGKYAGRGDVELSEHVLSMLGPGSSN